jgi:hypothetical protein
MGAKEGDIKEGEILGRGRRNWLLWVIPLKRYNPQRVKVYDMTWGMRS